MSSGVSNIGGRPAKVGTAVATGQNTGVLDGNYSRPHHTVYVHYTGTITSASLQVQVSPDNGTTWFNAGSPSTVATDHTFTVSPVAAALVRVAVTIVGGGTADIYIASAG